MLPISVLDRANMPPSAFDAQGKNGDVRYCTTGRQNTHVTDRREVLYPWHPWFGRLVYVHSVVDKPGDAVFRCNLTGLRSDRLLEVPIWMFDRTACASCRRSVSAHVSLEALKALAGLVFDAACFPLNKYGSPSCNDAASDSEQEIRRLAHAAQNDDDATRVVPGHTVRARDTDTALAKPSRQHAANADTADGTPDSRPRRRSGPGERS